MEGIISQPVDTLVIDSKALIQGGLKLKDQATNYVTVQEVFKEVRDRQAREQLNLLPFELKVRVPTDEAMKAVVNFTKQTGDFDILSKVDLRVLALTYTVEKELNGSEHIRSEPVPIQNNLSTNTESQHDDEEEYDEEEEDENQNGDNDEFTNDTQTQTEHENTEDQLTSQIGDLALDQEQTNGQDAEDTQQNDNQEGENAEEDDDDDDEDGWITPSNLKAQIQKEFEVPEEDSDRPSVKVACITGDYAMQRVLLQMNMNLFSLDGQHIKRINSYIMRCHGCYHITTNLSKQFCPRCGGHTLMRTTTSIDQNGNMVYYLKRNFKYRLRGTKYSIPNPKGGHKNKDLILREDTPQYQRRLAYNNRRKEQDLFDPDFIPEILVGRDSNQFNPNSLRVGYGRKNPNQAKRRSGRKKH